MSVKWTQSLDNDIRACRRKVFYGARFASPTARQGSLRRETVYLKQAVDLPLWRGNLVHKTIEKSIVPRLKLFEQPDFVQARLFLTNLIDKQVKFSESGRFRDISRNKAGDEYCVLRKNLEGENHTAEEIASVREEALIAIDNLETAFGDILERGREGKDPEAEKEIRFKLDENIHVEAILDFLFFEYGKGAVIVDWKSGLNLSSNAREQLYVYAFAVLKSGWWKALTCDAIELIEANLMTGDRHIYRIDEDDLDYIDNRIFAGSQLLRPIFEHRATECEPDDFESAKSPGTCAWCPVKEICNGNLQERATVQPALSLEFL